MFLDSTSDSSKRSRRESHDFCGSADDGASGLQHNEFYEDQLSNQDEGLLESYTKIWESFKEKDFFH